MSACSIETLTAFQAGAAAAIATALVSLGAWRVTLRYQTWRARRSELEEIEAMEEMDLFTAADAAAARDQALAQVEENNSDWVARAMRAFEALPVGMEMTGEVLRERVTAAAGAPKHHNAWGAFTNKLIRRGLLVPTGEMRPMRSEKSNARKTPVHVKVAA